MAVSMATRPAHTPRPWTTLPTQGTVVVNGGMSQWGSKTPAVKVVVFNISLLRRILSVDSPEGADCTICSDSTRGVPRSISLDHVPRIREGFVDRRGESWLTAFSFSMTLSCRFAKIDIIASRLFSSSFDVSTSNMFVPPIHPNPDTGARAWT